MALTPVHFSHLMASGLSAGIIEQRGYRSTDGEELAGLGFARAQCLPGILMPIWGVDGEVVGYQLRPDSPREKDGKPLKYETPAGWKMRLDAGAGLPKHLERGDLWITEGLKKGDSIRVRGAAAIALIGVWNWKSGTELADWDNVLLKDRDVYVAFDSDIVDKDSVLQAMRRLAGALKRRGASVHPVRIPSDGPDDKVGIDDYLAKGHTLDSLKEHVDYSLLTGREIVVNGRPLPDITEEAFAAIHASNDPPYLFVRGGKPVRVSRDEASRVKIEQLGPEAMRGVMARCADWVKKGDKNSKSQVFPPKDVVADVLAQPSYELPPLSGVSRCPVLSGRRCTWEEGYDHGSRLWIESPAIIPWEGTLEEARDHLLDLLVDFPFATDSDRAHAVAMMVLPLVRHRLGPNAPTPVHLLDAPTQSTGKSLLARVLLGTACGFPVAAKPAPKDDDSEWRKTLTSVIMEGAPYVFFDNLVGKIESASLDAAITGTEWSDRILGTNGSVTIPIRCVWAMSANNAQLSRDMRDRAVWIRLDAQMENPGDRQGFKYPDIEGYAEKSRARSLSALVKLVESWAEEGKPFSGRINSKFSEWCRVIGGILEHAGIDGFLGNVKEMREANGGEDAAWAAFYERWEREHWDARVTPGDVYRIFVDDETLAGLVSARDEKGEKMRLGRVLARRHGVVAGGRRVVRDGILNGSARYRLEMVQERNPAISVGNPVDFSGVSGLLSEGEAKVHCPESGSNESVSVDLVDLVDFSTPSTYARAHTCGNGIEKKSTKSTEPTGLGSNGPVDLGQKSTEQSPLKPEQGQTPDDWVEEAL